MRLWYFRWSAVVLLHFFFQSSGVVFFFVTRWTLVLNCHFQTSGFTSFLHEITMRLSNLKVRTPMTHSRSSELERKHHLKDSSLIAAPPPRTYPTVACFKFSETTKLFQNLCQNPSCWIFGRRVLNLGFCQPLNFLSLKFSLIFANQARPTSTTGSATLGKLRPGKRS